MTGARRSLKQSLEALIRHHPVKGFLANDPLGVVRERPAAERVIAAHVAAPLAYGAVGQIRLAARTVLESLARATSLEEAAFRYAPGTLPRALPGWTYRMTPVDALDNYLVALSSLIAAHGSLEAAFMDGDCEAGGDIRAPLTRYVRAIRDAMPAESRATRYLTPNPATGSAFKRWNLMLRWLVRTDDGVDLGLWTRVEASRLVLPLDRHVASLVRSLGLSRRRTVDYRMAREATDTLAEFCPEDPLRYDMALCHLGISGRCEHRYVAEICGSCELRSLCCFVTDPSRSRAGHDSST